MGPIDSQALKSLYEQGGDEALIQWVREQRDGLLMEDATEQQVHRRLDLLDKGVWQLDEGWLDLSRPQIYDIAKSMYFWRKRPAKTLVKACANYSPSCLMMITHLGAVGTLYRHHRPKISR